MTRKNILRLDGAAPDGGVSALLFDRLSSGEIEIVVTEENGPEACVVVTREQAEEMLRMLDGLFRVDGSGP